jgi:lysyl-tRNA synthetase, class II
MADPPSLLRLVRFVPIYLVAVLVFEFVALWVERDRIEPGPSVGDGLMRLARRGTRRAPA